MRKVIVFAERILPSTQTFIPAQVSHLSRFSAVYAGLVPAEENYEVTQEPVLLRRDRARLSKCARELYRWVGFGPAFNARLKSQQAELIHGHFAEGASAAAFLSRRLNIPLILHLHGGAELMTDADLYRRWFEWPFLVHRRRVWKRTALFLCASDYIRRQALKSGFPSDRLRVHYTGLDCAAFTSKRSVAEKDPDLVLFVGRLITYKGCDYLIRAMQLVTKERPNARLVVIGGGSGRHDLQDLARSLGIRCEFLGELKQDGVRFWLDRARLLCGPSVTLQDGQSEAFGIVFLEAQSMGVPVVSFRHGGIPEAICEGVTGLLAEERDVAGLATHILRYLSDEAFWSRSREEGIRWVRSNFDIRMQTASLERIYVRTIGDFRSTSGEHAINDV